MVLLQKLKAHKKLNGTLLLGLMSVFCLCLSIIRCVITGSEGYIFLNWNLFLAFIPWIVSTLIVLYGYQEKKWLLIILLFTWILFFPNSPYILTDLFHLKSNSRAPVWFDWALILSYGWTGLIIGFISLSDLEKILQRYFPARKALLIVIFLLLLSGFGVYVGRFLRWNSWDVISDPFSLGEDLLQRVIHPLLYIRTWLISLLFGFLFTMMYFSARLVATINTD